ncbi:MAG TPA: hypothetical protein VNR18_13460, partial [Hyphomicrobiales bacterium]|nr:hypothetical protein [Hyphomicrobiales bacterium]
TRDEMRALRRHGVPVRESMDSGVNQALQNIARQLQAPQPLTLIVMTPDGQELKREVFADIKKRSRNGELVVYAQGVGA